MENVHHFQKKNVVGSVSNPLESQKIPLAAFPTPWKDRKCRWQRFQPLGKSENTVGSASNPLESQKISLAAFPTPWKVRKYCWQRFQPLEKSENIVGSVSNPLERYLTTKSLTLIF
nr:hypothetical protein [uncultured Prevotella sp.]